MQKNESSIRSNVFSIILAIFAIIAGITIGFFALTDAYQELSSEHNEHLVSLVWSTDNNLDNLFKYCRKELQDAVRNYDSIESNNINDCYKTEDIIQSDKMDAVVVLKDGKLVSSSDASIKELEFLNNYSNERPCLCTDNYGKTYLTLIELADKKNSDLAVLISADKFFDKFVGKELTDYYWLALYDIEDGICLQDDATQAFIKNITYDEALDRNDGITFIAQSERKGEILSGNYEFKAQSTSSTDFIITTLPTAVNNNGYFTIGLSVPTDHYASILKHIFVRTSLCGALILFGTIILVLLFRRHAKANAAMRADINLLEKKNEAMRELMESSQELAHQQRLVTIGTIASSINHEFSNQLTPILGYSVMAMEKADAGDEEMMDYLEKIYEASSKAKDLVARLLKMSRKSSNMEWGEFSPDEMLENIEHVLSPSLPKNVDIVKNYNCPEKCLYASESQIEQVVMNIILNAFQAMSQDGGVLTITTIRSDDYITISMRDTGPGIPQDILNHIFEPFYTTKAEDKGTGLGLTIVAQTIEAHHGTVEVTSEVGVGTEFLIKLPIYKPTQE